MLEVIDEEGVIVVLALRLLRFFFFFDHHSPQVLGILMILIICFSKFSALWFAFRLKVNNFSFILEQIYVHGSVIRPAPPS
jgi:hypothetical protein